MMRSAVRSNRVGRAALGTGVITIAYRAIVAFECVECAGASAPGALFSRQTRRTPRVGWVCRRPIPSALPADRCAWRTPVSLTCRA